MLYDDEIHDSSKCSQRLEVLNWELLEAWESVLGFDTMEKKKKEQATAAVPCTMFVTRHGPNPSSITQSQEKGNIYTRSNAENTNHHTLSLYIGRRMGDAWHHTIWALAVGGIVQRAV
ncbi:hypothetical protein K470DRAFT_12375 [Piedraia hortae CBS 480.64]|uniref:Uncharacterized protein n=1 Tax=Piedraia hortae CBS 480.64 TaxID=1314780 RepID=A0A6A7BP89_9PEZI|nr:hypothetical protein K470DRAFT_12375 [Piedraia hortae CBS 480.64]